MCKARAITFGKPYNLYSGVDAAGSVLFYEPINPYYLILRCLCVFYATAVLIWSMADLAVHSLPYTLWFAFRINWISLLIWVYFVSSLLISLLVNNSKRRGQNLEIPAFDEWDPNRADGDGDADAAASADYRDLRALGLFYWHQISRLCLQLSVSAIVFVAALYFMDYEKLASEAEGAVPKLVLNVQTHGVLAMALMADYFTSCTQIRYATGTLLVLLFNGASMAWTYLFYRADFFNPLTGTNILYPIADWSGAAKGNLTSMAEMWVAGTCAHWVIHMILVYLKFVVICNWIDRRRFTMDIVDEKDCAVKMVGGEKVSQGQGQDQASVGGAGPEWTPLLL